MTLPQLSAVYLPVLLLLCTTTALERARSHMHTYMCLFVVLWLFIWFLVVFAFSHPTSSSYVFQAAWTSSAKSILHKAMRQDRDAPPSLALSMGSCALAPAMAAVFTNPADVAKTRLNMASELQAPSAAANQGVFGCLRSIYGAEGIAGLQRGLGLVCLREASKNTFRIGLYEPLVRKLEGRSSSSAPSTVTRVAAGAMTGGLSALICNPLDLLKTRIQLDPGRGAGSTASSALRQVVSAEGVVGLWRRGAMANVARSSIASMLGLPTNMYLKECANALQLPWLQRTPALRDAVCALGASAAVVMLINPLDLIRTRLFSQPTLGEGMAALGTSGAASATLISQPASMATATAAAGPMAVEASNAASPRYSGILDCARRVAATEGIAGFWKGSFASFLRVGPHQTLTFVLIGLLQRMHRDLALQ